MTPFGYRVLGFGGNRNYGVEGGIATTYSGYKVHSFTTVETTSILFYETLDVDILLVGGGGGVLLPLLTEVAVAVEQVLFAYFLIRPCPEALIL